MCDEATACSTCGSVLDWFKGYYGKWSRCPNHCVKCDLGCDCACSKRRVECKECKFCTVLIPVANVICGEIYEEGCCSLCKGDCDYVCAECKNNCDDVCACLVDCQFCDGKLLRSAFLDLDGENRSQAYTSHGQAVGSAAPICDDCQGAWCYCSEGPCATPCKECGTTCDAGCGCTCSACGSDTEQGGCKCYDEEYIAAVAQRDHRDMRKRFVTGQELRHVIKGDVMTGVYDLANNQIVCGDLRFDSLSGFAKAHYAGLGLVRSVNGWKECEYKVADAWTTTV